LRLASLLAEDRERAKLDLGGAQTALEEANENLRQKINIVRVLQKKQLITKAAHKKGKTHPQKRSGRKQERDQSNREQDKTNQTAQPTTCLGSRSGNAPWHTPELLSAGDIARLSEPASGVAPFPDPARSAAIAARAHYLLNKDVLRTCAVCDHAEFDTNPLVWNGLRHRTMSVSDMPGAMQLLLHADDALQLDADLRSQYDVSELVSDAERCWVADLLLSPRGMGENDQITICNNCDGSLQSNTKPKWAIANGCPSDLLFSRCSWCAALNDR
jgi:hypothetical protein